MKKETREVATSFTTLTFLVIAISGVMMFFHFNDMLVKELHEILGLVFVAAAFLHVFVNWKSMKSYFSKKIFISALVITTAVSGLFIFQSADKGDNPKKIMMEKIMTAPLIDSLKVLNGNYENAIKKLASKNIQILDNKTLKDLAKANNTNPFKIVGIVTSK